MIRRLVALVTFSVLLAASASAQQPAPPTLDTKHNVAPADSSINAKPPALTEVEMLKLQLNMSQVQSVQQQYQLLQMQARQLDAEREALLQAIEKGHPGWLFDRASLQFKRPEPPAPAPPKATPPPTPKK